MHSNLEKRVNADVCSKPNVNYLVSEFVTNDMVAERNIVAELLRAISQ